jgi:hypothetical protein
MSCPVCPQKLTREVYSLVNKACGPCQKQIKQMMAGFHGVIAEPRRLKTTWDNTSAFEEWKAHLTSSDVAVVHLRKKDDYTTQRCDLRDMKKSVGLPKFLPLEAQVFTAWILEGQKDERIQEVLGLTYSQLFAVKSVVKKKLQKQMAYYKQVQKLAKETDNGRI